MSKKYTPTSPILSSGVHVNIPIASATFAPFSTSDKFFRELRNIIGHGFPSCFSEIVEDHRIFSTQADKRNNCPRQQKVNWWRPWKEILQFRYDNIVRQTYDPQENACWLVPVSNMKTTPEKLSEDWKQLLVKIRNKAERNWGNSIYPNGCLIRPNKNDSELPRGRYLYDGTAKYSSAYIDLTCYKAWGAEQLDQLKKDCFVGCIQNFPIHNLDQKSNLMIISDELSFFECSTRWQNRQPQSHIEKIIPDIWVYRMVECLIVEENQVCRVYLFANPTWSFKDFLQRAAFESIQTNNCL